jgi:hypothetical protein
MEVIRDKGKYTRSDILAKQPDWLGLEKVFELLVFKEFDKFGDVLSAVTGDDEESVGSFDDD